MIKLYKVGKLKISEREYKIVENAYNLARRRLSGGGIGLDYVLPEKEVVSHERRERRYRPKI